jgi:hypothetical protein
MITNPFDIAITREQMRENMLASYDEIAASTCKSLLSRINKSRITYGIIEWIKVYYTINNEQFQRIKEYICRHDISNTIEFKFVNRTCFDGEKDKGREYNMIFIKDPDYIPPVKKNDNCCCIS